MSPDISVAIKYFNPCYFLPEPEQPPAVESSIAVKDAVESRGLCRVIVSCLFWRGFRHYSTTIASKNLLSSGNQAGLLEARSGVCVCVFRVFNCPTRRAFLCTLYTETLVRPIPGFVCSGYPKVPSELRPENLRLPRPHFTVLFRSADFFRPFFGIFFSYFRGPGRGGGFSIFSVIWEVLKGVGVDGAGGNLPFFCAFLRFSSLFWRESPLFWRFSSLFLRFILEQGQFTGKMGNFTPTPSAPTPLRSSRVIFRISGIQGLWSGKTITPQTVTLQVKIERGLKSIKISTQFATMFLLAPCADIRERKISPKFFRPKFFRGRPRGMSVSKCLFFQDLEGLTEVFGRMSAGISGQKLPLWAEFSFLRNYPAQKSN